MKKFFTILFLFSVALGAKDKIKVNPDTDSVFTTCLSNLDKVPPNYILRFNTELSCWEAVPPEMAAPDLPSPPPVPQHMYNAFQSARWEYEKARANNAQAYNTLILTPPGLRYLQANNEYHEKTVQKDELKSQLEKWCNSNGSYLFNALTISCVPSQAFGTPIEISKHIAEQKAKEESK